MTSVVTAAGVSVTMRDVVSEAQSVLDRLVADGVPRSLTSGNTRLWGIDAEPDAAKRLGWLRLPESSQALLPVLDKLADPDLDQVIVSGMGGASLAPGVIAAVHGRRVTPLGTSDPHQAGRIVSGDLSRTRAVVASKSGTTVETHAHLRILEDAFRRSGIDPAERIVVVTDPGSPLQSLAEAAGYPLVLADPEVSGPFGALSAAGLTACALAGGDVSRVLEDAAGLSAVLAQPYENPGLALGAALGASALSGRDKLVVADHGSGLDGFPSWIEHLLATATGKDGKGLLPVVVDGADDPGFALTPHMRRVILGSRPDEAGPARDAGIGVSGPLGAQFLLWEYATAVAARVLTVNPFDQPGVREAKDNTSALLRGTEEGEVPTLIMGEPAVSTGAVQVHGPRDLLKGVKNLSGVFDALLSAVPEDGYLAVMAFLDEIGDRRAAALRPLLAERSWKVRRTGVPVTFGWGPGFLHTTGQYHKHGPQNGVFVQLTGEVMRDVPVPGQPYGLKHLQLAQAFGDLRALRSRERPAVRIHLRSRAEGVSQLLDALAP
jgi:glucose-6-phosphate isomerase